jgi:NADH dehydrogenase FAD-containing subunit
MTNARHRAVIIGAGFGGLFAARWLRRAPVEVTIVDRTNHHLFQPLLYQVATGVLSEGDIAPPIRDVLRKQRNIRVLMGEVTDIDLAARELVLDTGGPDMHSLRQPDSSRGRVAVVLRPRRVRDLRTKPEDDRRRARAARADLRGLRAR